MNNLQRICEICLLNNIYTPDELQALLKAGKEPAVHTKNYWKKAGKIPRHDATGIETKLWIKNQSNGEYYLRKTILYSESMVESI